MAAVDHFILGAAIPAALFLAIAVALMVLAMRGRGRPGRWGTCVSALGAACLALSFGFVAVMGAML
ncbi:hypothetical protein RN629_14385 [Sphingomonadaceae bacterium jetA1]|jgi:hypothetical protein|uniref:hypothetical protein n=1 Tax=Facivitalis istanbulensis TaxID=3075838 RepID=UPI003497241B